MDPKQVKLHQLTDAHRAQIVAALEPIMAEILEIEVEEHYILWRHPAKEVRRALRVEGSFLAQRQLADSSRRIPYSHRRHTPFHTLNFLCVYIEQLVILLCESPHPL